MTREEQIVKGKDKPSNTEEEKLKNKEKEG